MTKYRLYHIVDQQTDEGFLVWSYSRKNAVELVTEHQFSVAPVTQRELCRLLASGVNPINEPPDEEEEDEA